MDDKLRRQVLEQYAKDVKDGLTESGDYVKRRSNPLKTALEARDLAEDSLANEVLKKTGVPIPGKGANKSQIENFYADLMKERYPELKNQGIEIKKLKDAYGTFDPTSGIIELDEDTVRKSPIKSTSTLLHEAGHKYDKDILNKFTDNDLQNKDIRSALKNLDLNVNTDPTDIAEKLLKGHHSDIPKLREGSFGLGALKSMMKSGTFKALPIIGPAIGAGMAAMSGEANAASALPILGESESLEPSPEDYVIENPQANPDLRKKALQNLAGK